MTAPKLLNRYGVLAALESTYLTAATLTDAGSGIGHIIENPEPVVDFVHNGERNGLSMGTSARLARVGKSGRFSTLSLVTQAAGPGSAYSGSRFPSPHVLLRASGFDVTTVTTGGSESHTYAPTADQAASMASATVRVYTMGQQFDLTGYQVNELTIEAESGAVPTWTFNGMGVLASAPTDVTLPAITYGGANREAEVQPPAKFEAGTVTIGSWTPARVRGFRYTMSRVMEPRALDNSTGNHGGWSIGERTHQLELRVESAALSAFNPYTNEVGATALSNLALVVGGTQYRRYTLGNTTGITALLADAEREADGPTALWRLVFDLFPSSPTANDEFRILFN